jgi:hypothetical protein
MSRKRGYQFSEKIMLNKKIERDDDSSKSRPLSSAPVAHDIVRLAANFRMGAPRPIRRLTRCHLPHVAGHKAPNIDQFSV